MSFNILPTEWELQSGEASNVMGKWDKKGIVMASKEPWENVIENFPCTVMRCGDYTRIYYFTYIVKGECTLALAEIGPDGKIDRHILKTDPKEYFSMCGLPESWDPIQPNVLQLSENEYRMYFWVHGEGICRFLIAESRNGLNWQVKDTDSAVLYHHNNDAEPGKGNIPARKVANDATTVYRRPDGTFEMYSANVLFVPKDDPRFIEHDLSNGAIRFVERWESPDGINWSSPEIVAMPDKNDPVDLQFYYLSAADIPGGRLGMVGYYTAENQIMELELMHSIDGRQWSRHKRGACFPLENDDEIYGMYAPHNLVEEGDNLVMYYSGTNHSHNFHEFAGEKISCVIARADINKYRIFGRKINSGIVVSPLLALTEPSWRLYLEQIKKCTLEWCDAFGCPLPIPPVSLKSSGNCNFVSVSVPAELLGAVARIRLTGCFTLYNLCPYEDIY